MMGLIGQGCEHGDVLEVTGTNTPTQKTTPRVFFMCGRQENVLLGASVCRKKKNDDCVCVCCTVFDTTHPIGVVCFMGLCWWF